jgi:D-sedoheptulose 7-phosphate isomerase
MTDSNHPLRKPNAGMLYEAAFDYNIDLSKSWMIGDRMTDVEAGHRAGCRSIFICGTEEPQSHFSPPEGFATNLQEAARLIVNSMNV